MTVAAWVALMMAIFGAFSYGAGSILQAVGAMRSSNTVRTLGHPLYLLGVGCDLLAWAASMVALREMAVYQVQSVLAGSLAITVVLARVFLAARLRGRDVAAVTITIAALTVLAMSAGPQEAVPPSGPLRLGFCVAAVALAALGWSATRVGSAGVVAALAGTAFGGAALSGRALPMPSESPNMFAFVLALLMEPMTWALLIFAASGMLLYTNALQHGQVGPVTAVLWIGEVVAPSAVGLLVLGDTVRPGWNVAAALAGLVTIAAAVVLGSAPASADQAPATAGAAPRHRAPMPPMPGAAMPGVPGPRHAMPRHAMPAPRPGVAMGRASVPSAVALAAMSDAAVAPAPVSNGRPVLWPTLSMPDRFAVQLRPFVEPRTATIRWWGPPTVDRNAGTFWWWGTPSDPQLIWVPPNRLRRPPAQARWR